MLLCLVDLDQEELLHLLQLRCLLPRPLSLLVGNLQHLSLIHIFKKIFSDLSSPQAVLIVHGKAVDNNGNGKGQDENSREGAKTANLDFFLDNFL